MESKFLWCAHLVLLGKKLKFPLHQGMFTTWRSWWFTVSCIWPLYLFYGTDCKSFAIHCYYFCTDNKPMAVHSMAVHGRTVRVQHFMNTLRNAINTSRLHAPQCLSVSCTSARNVKLCLNVSWYTEDKFLESCRWSQICIVVEAQSSRWSTCTISDTQIMENILCFSRQIAKGLM